MIMLNSVLSQRLKPHASRVSRSRTTAELGWLT